MSILFQQTTLSHSRRPLITLSIWSLLIVLAVSLPHNPAWATKPADQANASLVKAKTKPFGVSRILKTLLLMTLYLQGSPLPAKPSSSFEVQSSVHLPTPPPQHEVMACTTPGYSGTQATLPELIRSLNEEGSLDVEPSLSSEEKALLGYQKMFESQNIHISGEQIQAILRLAPSFKSIRPLTKSGINTAYELVDKHGIKHFLKLFTDEEAQAFNSQSSFAKQFPSLHEAASSSLASYLTGGLVPGGISSGGDVILFPLVETDPVATRKVFFSEFPNFQEEDVYPRLNTKQKEQLLSHLVADLILESDDTHSGNFAIDKHGNLVAFDKGRSHYDKVFKSTQLDPFALDFKHLEKSKVYKEFIVHLKNNPDELKRLFQSDDVQDTLHRVELLVENPNEIRDRMSPFLSYLKRRVDSNLSHSASQASSPAHYLESLEKSYFDRFRNVRSGLQKYFDLTEQDLAYRPSVQDPKFVLNYKHEIQDGFELDTLEFDPRKYRPQLKAPIEKGIPGDKVSNIVNKSKGLAGINAGFFSFGDGAGLFTWLKYKAGNKLGQSHNPAFPSAILKTQNHLLSDTSVDNLPALGWTEDGSRSLISNVKVKWKAKIPNSPTELHLVRQTPLNHETNTQYLYFPSTPERARLGGHDQRIKIVNERVTEIIPYSKEIDKDLPNSYAIDAQFLANSDFKWASLLKQGGALPIEHEFLSNNVRGWNKMDYIVSGGEALVKNGVAETTFALDREPNSRNSRTAVCIMPNGTWKMIISHSGATLHELSHYMQKQGCDQGINLDGGGSPTLHLNSGSSSETLGTNIVVSDAIVVMPRELPTLNSTQKQGIYRFVQDGALTETAKIIESHPELLGQQDHLGRTPLQFAVELNQFAVAEFLIEHMTPKQLSITDHYGDTALHSALRNEQLGLAEKLTPNFDFQALSLPGLGDDTPIGLLSKFPESKAFSEVRKTLAALKSIPPETNLSDYFLHLAQIKDTELLRHLASILTPENFENSIAPLFSLEDSKGDQALKELMPFLPKKLFLEGRDKHGHFLHYLTCNPHPDFQHFALPFLRSKLPHALLTERASGMINLLEIAISFKNQEAIRALLPQYSLQELEVVNDQGSGVLEAAVKASNYGLAQEFLFRFSKERLLAVDNQDETLLDIALQSLSTYQFDPNFLRHLISVTGKKLLTRKNKEGLTAIQKFVKNGPSMGNWGPDVLKLLMPYYGSSAFTELDKEGRNLLALATESQFNPLLPHIVSVSPPEAIRHAKVGTDKNILHYALKHRAHSNIDLLKEIVDKVPKEWWDEESLLSVLFKSEYAILDNKILKIIEPHLSANFMGQILPGHSTLLHRFDFYSSNIDIELLKKLVQKFPPNLLNHRRPDTNKTPLDLIFTYVKGEHLAEVLAVMPASVFTSKDATGSNIFIEQRHSTYPEYFSKSILPRIPPEDLFHEDKQGHSFFNQIRLHSADKFKVYIAGVNKAAFFLTDPTGKTLFELLRRSGDEEVKMLAIVERLSAKELSSLTVQSLPLLDWAKKNSLPNLANAILKKPD